eukprot:13627711-Alexandrium_andersonii.AAC.1
MTAGAPRRPHEFPAPDQPAAAPQSNKRVEDIPEPKASQQQQVAPGSPPVPVTCGPQAQAVPRGPPGRPARRAWSPGRGPWRSRWQRAA